MRILYDYEIFTRQKYGGISRYFYEIITRIGKEGIADVDLFLGINSTGYNFDIPQSTISIEEKRIRNAEKFHLLLNSVNRRMFEKHASRKKYDLFHKTYYSNSGLCSKIPVISTIHDMTHELYPEFFAKADNTSELKHRVADASEAIVCVSETTKRDLMKCFNISENKIRVIYHGLSLHDSGDNVRIVAQPYILYVGQRWGYKNFGILVKAIETSNTLKTNFKLVCFGGGKLSLSEKLYIKEKGLQDNIIFISGNDKLLVNLYKYAEILVYTSVYEGFGFPPLEAMSLGCPVLTSPAGSVKEVAGDAAIYFDPFNIEELAEKMLKVLNESQLRKDLSSKGTIQAGLFSWDDSAKKHLDLYKEISNSN